MSCILTLNRRAIVFTRIVAVALLLLALSAVSAAQATFNTLLTFDGTNGSNPYYIYLAQGTDGQLYGTDFDGGLGTIYKVSTAGTLSQLWTFCGLTNCADGDMPVGGLVLGANGNFYGTASNTNVSGTGSASGGTIFEITSAGTFTLLHTFTGSDGALPYSNMILASNGNFYGTTLYGGTNLTSCSGLGCGTFFEITPQGKFTSLYSFTGGSDGQWPIGRLFQGNNGNFYGTTIVGGSGGFGTVFQITAGGQLTTLYSFTNTGDGASPYGGVVQAANGNIYGTTSYGGSSTFGTFFKLSSSNKLTTLYNFCSQLLCADGAVPYAGLIQASDGNFYGTTTGGGTFTLGTVFEITAGGKLTSLYSFCSQLLCADGFDPAGGGLVQDTNGTFYGATYQGGNTSSQGTLFSLSNGLGSLVQPVINAGKVGASVTILGNSLKGTTSVTFNGTAATFKVSSSGMALSATVPSGATTGTIKVVAPSGTLSTTSSFKVTPQILSFSPPSGKVGASVTITGVSLSQTSQVTFGGVVATFTVNTDSQVTATVPTGAKSGKIVITTPGGTATSATSFTVK